MALSANSWSFSGSMQWSLAHGSSFWWTALSTSGVILTAAYMLWMIQRVFYGGFGIKSERVAGWDLDTREHIALWPLVIVFLAMGVASPYWTRAIDTFGVAIGQAAVPATIPADTASHSSPNTFLDPALAAAALGKQAPQTNKGAHY